MSLWHMGDHEVVASGPRKSRQKPDKHPRVQTPLGGPVHLGAEERAILQDLLRVNAPNTVTILQMSQTRVLYRRDGWP